MNCPHCGNPISPTARFCPNCGADLGVEETIISRMPPLSDIPTMGRSEGVEETIISRTPLSPAYEPPPAPPTYPPEGEKGGRNTLLIVAVVLILLCCCCLIGVLAAYMLLGEDILSEISLAFLLV
jgi:hypothetical protein